MAEICGMEVFTVLDLKNSFWQLVLDDASSDAEMAKLIHMIRELYVGEKQSGLSKDTERGRLSAKAFGISEE